MAVPTLGRQGGQHNVDGLGLRGGVKIRTGAGAPTDGTTLAGVAGPGSLYIDYTNAVVYVNNGTKASPAWSPLGGGSVAGTREVKNDSGGAIAAGDLVAITGWDEATGYMEISKADANASSYNVAEYVALAAIANGASGLVGRTHRLTGQATNGLTVGDPVFLHTTAGGWTATPPTSGATVQRVGRVAVVHASTGVVALDVDPARASGVVNVALVAGQDETGDTTIPVTGIAVGDRLVSVMVQDGTSGVFTQRAISDFGAITAGNIAVGANAANNAANKYVITWMDLT